MPEQFWWFVTRSSGIVTLLASGAAVIWGLLLSTRVIRRRSLPKWLLDLHRFLGALTVSMLALHLAALVADNYVHFGVADLAVPFASDWRTGAVAWGVVAAWVLVAVQATSMLRTRLPKRVWRWVHLSSFVAFGMSLAHALAAGTDRTNPVYLALAVLMTLVVVFLGVVRILADRGSRPASERPRRDAPAIAADRVPAP